MTTTQIIIVIAISILCFILGRKTKRVKFPLMGRIDLTRHDEYGEVIPKMQFGCNDMTELEKYNYIALEIISNSRQNHTH